MPRVRFAVGCHPHNAKFYDDDLERALLDRLADPRVSAVGEIGLDYHYDFSPREDQREAFRRQIRVAKQAGLPVVLHIREAHDEAFAILQEEGFPEAGTLLHCFNLDWAELERWVEAGCHVAFGEEREAFLRRLLANAYALLDREPTPWQRERAQELGIEELSPAERARVAVAQWRAGKA